MALFVLGHLVDDAGAYKRAMKRLIHRRYEACYHDLGLPVPADPNLVGYYAILDLEFLGTATYGSGVVDWLLANKNPFKILFRLADEAGVVLLPGKGFGTPHPSARVSLANLSARDYVRIGEIVRATMNGYFAEFRKGANHGRMD